MSGNGVYEPHNCTNALFSQTDPPLHCIPPGQGGGCVKTGPFKEWASHTHPPILHHSWLELNFHCSYVVNFAPVFPSLAEPELNFSLPFLSYDPRCLKRDVSVWVSSNWTKDIDSYDLITGNTDIYWFQQIMQGNGFIDGFYGVHTAGKQPFQNFQTFIRIQLLTSTRALYNWRRSRWRLLRFSRRSGKYLDLTLTIWKLSPMLMTPAGILAPSWTNWSYVVDLAKSRPQEPSKLH